MTIDIAAKVANDTVKEANGTPQTVVGTINERDKVKVQTPQGTMTISRGYYTQTLILNELQNIMAGINMLVKMQYQLNKEFFDNEDKEKARQSADQETETQTQGKE